MAEKKVLQIPYLKNGRLTGDFTLCKRGQNFEVKLVKVD